MNDQNTIIFEELRRMLCELLLLEPDDVKPQSLLVQELSLDSLGFAELEFAIEEKFDVTFPDVKATPELFALSLPEGLARIEAIPGATTLFEYMKAEVVGRKLADGMTAEELCGHLARPLPAGVENAAAVTSLEAAHLEEILGAAAHRNGNGNGHSNGNGNGNGHSNGNGASRNGDVLGRLDATARDVLFKTATVAGLAAAAGGRVPTGLAPETSVNDLHLADLFRFVTVDMMARYVERLVEKRAAAAPASVVAQAS